MTEGTDQSRKREDAFKVLLGRICCLLGLLFGAGGIIFSILSVSVNVSAGAVGVVALFFMAAASTGLIPGVAPPRIRLVVRIF